MSKLLECLAFLFAAACIQNVVLTTGLGSSLLLYLGKNPRGLKNFSLLFLGFTVASMCTFYPIDLLLTDTLGVLFRPVVLLLIISLWYIGASLFALKKATTWYAQNRTIFPYAAFNTAIIGVCLMSLYRFHNSFFGALGLAIGTGIGFLVMLYVTMMAIDRMNHPDVPKAFQGLPLLLLYLGLLGLAICGFRSPITFI